MDMKQGSPIGRHPAYHDFWVTLAESFLKSAIWRIGSHGLQLILKEFAVAHARKISHVRRFPLVDSSCLPHTLIHSA